MPGLMWNMKALVKAIESGADVLWAAGEKDAERIQAVLDEAGSDAVATCVHQGESAPVELEQADLFKGFAGRVLLYFDRDPTGIGHALNRRALLAERLVASEIRSIPEGVLVSGAEPNDISDFLDQGGRLSDCRKVQIRALRQALKEHTVAKAAAGGKAVKPRSKGSRAPAVVELGGGGSDLLKAFVKVLGKPERVAGDRRYWRCPSQDHSDRDPSFSVAQGKGGGLVLACSCPGGMAKGKEHKDWVTSILGSLGLTWKAVAAPGATEEGLFEHERNDQGNAQVLADLHSADLLSVQGGDLLAWDGRRWVSSAALVNAMLLDVAALRHREADATSDPKARAAVRAFAVSCGNGSRLREMERQAAFTLPSVKPGSLDARRTVLPVANGTIDLEELGHTFRPHRREDRFTRLAAAEYRPGVSSELWEEFLGQFVPGREERGFLQKLMGYALLGWNRHRLLAVITGPTSTGKTTFLNIIMDTIGADFAGTFQLSMLRTRRDDAPRPDILKAMPRRILVAEEGSTEWQLHADTIKQLTSGGKIEARGMRSNEFTERTPAFLPLIATNDYPVIRYADAALKRRLVGFPFHQQISQGAEDAGFRTRFRARDRAAVLMWMLEGFDLYCHEGLGEPPGEAARATAELRQALNPTDIFLAECTTTEPFASGKPARASASVLFQALQDWWEEQKFKPSELPTKTAFGRHLTDSGYPLGLPGRRDEGGSRSRYREGLRLRLLSG